MLDLNLTSQEIAGLLSTAATLAIYLPVIITGFARSPKALFGGLRFVFILTVLGAGFSIYTLWQQLASFELVFSYMYIPTVAASLVLVIMAILIMARPSGVPVMVFAYIGLGVSIFNAVRNVITFLLQPRSLVVVDASYILTYVSVIAFTVAGILLYSSVLLYNQAARKVKKATLPS
ncbi:MAG: hypothetical protein LBR44_02805 [Clostridiales Family XIII bacterium]|jgi:hypothetical protein|nr:hypothetical protein [Clostridiales Family XIII bacterium]